MKMGVHVNIRMSKIAYADESGRIYIRDVRQLLNPAGLKNV